jgi:DNA recombination protein RmuC
MEILIAAFIGILMGFFLGRFASKRPEATPAGTESALAPLQDLLAKAREDLKEKQLECQGLTHELAKAEQSLADVRKQYATREKEVVELQDRFKQEFSVLAEKLLEEKGKKLNEIQHDRLAAILKPLQEKIVDFDDRLNKAQIEDTKQRSSLEEKIKSLSELNLQMADDARRLTQALKGDTKVQGNWGEMVLEKILEKSGLQKGREYMTQDSLVDENERRLRPDVVIYLPEDRHLVVDSKVSLTAYERYVSAEDPGDKEKYRREHLLSLRNHIKSLGSKDYSSLPQIKSPDFVFLFVAVEPAFQLALQWENELIGEAFGHKVILAGPSTLLAATSTVANIWRHERQNRNVLEIAKVGGALVDKLVLFLNDLETVRRALSNAEKALDLATKKLSDGNGSVLKRAHKLQQLGAKSSKQLPPLDAALEDDDEQEADEEPLSN